MSSRGAAVTLTASAGVIALALLGLVSPSSVAEDKPSSARAFLTRFAHAEGATYRARQLVVYFGQPQSAALVDVQSTHDTEFVRAESGPMVTKLWHRPDMGIVSSTAESLVESAPLSVPISPKDVLAKYDIDVGPPEQLLGVDVVPLTLKRRDDGAVIERWLVHAKSGIVYRRGFYDAKDHLVGLSTIIDMHWGDDAGAERFDPGAHAPSRVHRIKAHDAPKRLAQGYHLLEAYSLRIGHRHAQHWVYSDGLHALSVFRTNGGMRRPAGFSPARIGKTKAWAGPGPGTWAWEGHGHGYIMVAEEPALDPSQLTEPFPKGGRSVLARMGSVWSGMFHAVGRLFR